MKMPRFLVIPVFPPVWFGGEHLVVRGVQLVPQKSMDIIKRDGCKFISRVGNAARRDRGSTSKKYGKNKRQICHFICAGAGNCTARNAKCGGANCNSVQIL